MDAPTRGQRIAAWTSLVCVGLLTVMVFLMLVNRPGALLLAVFGLVLLGAGGWWMVTERGTKRILGIVGLAAALILIIVALVGSIADAGWSLVVALAVIALTALAAGQTRMAVAGSRKVDGVPYDKPRHPVLIANPKSGGGKVAKFGLQQAAEQQGVEVIMLGPGDDLEQLARDAIARGADCLGMAGGDGSQALVASVAIEHDIPFVCVSAGTRNHFAMDLGLDRDDPAEGIAAFSHGLERRIDYATVGDRLFVNNVSMGVYATIVQRDSYRDAKLETSLDLLPQLLGEHEEPFDLQFGTPDGTEVDGAFVVLVSNNPYVLGPKLDVASRRSLTSGRLGVFTISARTGAEAGRLVARSTFGLARRDPNVHEFTAGEFEVRSRSGTAFAGVDGEALELTTPLRFAIHPGGLRVRVPEATVGRLRRRWSRDISIGDLFRVARGRALPDPEVHTG